jgi:hypothetical protein
MRAFMNVFVAAAAVVALATPAHSQGQGGFGGNGGGGRVGPPAAGVKPEDRVNEKDYKSALDRLPAQGEKRDPWQTVRDKPQTK